MNIFNVLWLCSNVIISFVPFLKNEQLSLVHFTFLIFPLCLLFNLSHSKLYTFAVEHQNSCTLVSFQLTCLVFWQFLDGKTEEILLTKWNCSMLCNPPLRSQSESNPAGVPFYRQICNHLFFFLSYFVFYRETISISFLGDVLSVILFCTSSSLAVESIFLAIFWIVS